MCTDGPVLQHQGISNLSAEYKYIRFQLFTGYINWVWSRFAGFCLTHAMLVLHGCCHDKLIQGLIV